MRGAKIIITRDLLLKWLQFEGGELVRVLESDDVYAPTQIAFIIAHPDLPEVREGERYLEVCPSYRTEYDNHGCLISLMRLDPPKRSNERK